MTATTESPPTADSVVRDPKYTLRLEPALRCLVKHPTHALNYIEHRFDLERGEVSAWLAAFNQGDKQLTDTRIDAVKSELGSVKVVKAPAAPSLPRGVNGEITVDEAPFKVAPAPAPATPPASPAPAPSLDQPTSDIGRWLQLQRAKVVGRVNCFQVEVTPALAEAWLKFNDGNRRPSKSKIRRFTAAMKAGRWILNGETVKFSITGRLLDGQSRLMAIVDAGVPISLEVRGGLPDVAQKTMDCGELRKTSHTLEMMGVIYPSETGRALKLCWLLEKGLLAGNKFGVSAVMENNEVPAMVERHAALKDSVEWMASAQNRIVLIMPKSDATFFHYIFGVVDRDLRDPFFEALVEGCGLTKLSPIFHLRSWLLTKRAESYAKQSKHERWAYIIKAWNHARRGDKISGLRVIAGEAFPSIDGWQSETQK